MNEEPQIVGSSAARQSLTDATPVALELLADPLTDLTRRRQALLLIAGSLTLLISYAVVKPGSSGTVLGVTITFTKPDVVPTLCGLVTAYFLIVYLLGVYADWTVRRVRQWAPLAVFNEITAKTALEVAARGRVIDGHVTALFDRVK